MFFLNAIYFFLLGLLRYIKEHTFESRTNKADGPLC
jgi:hypothetical protein